MVSDRELKDAAAIVWQASKELAIVVASGVKDRAFESTAADLKDVLTVLDSAALILTTARTLIQKTLAAATDG